MSSRMKFPFRSQSSSQMVNGTHGLTNGDAENGEPVTMMVEAGKDIERLWGLENFGNTCYCNSVLQALYACEPFRLFIESYGDAPPPITALGPQPGEAHKSPTTPGPLSPTSSSKNPFDNPTLTNQNSTSSPNNDKKRGLFSRRPTSSGTPVTPGAGSLQATLLTPAPAAAPVTLISESDIPPIQPNPNGPAPSVFETVQTLFHHLSTSLPHQPLPAKKDAKKDGEQAQTASLLPSEVPGQPANPTDKDKPGSPTQPKEPQGPPLLASLPPPSAPRGGGPYQAGTLGRGVVRPEDLLKTVKRENDMFRGMSQQDAHEFLGWVLNKLADDTEIIDRSLREVGKSVPSGPGRTFVHRLFEGVLTNETRCLSCETTSSRDEQFLDLSIDIEQHTSVTACLRQFSTSEMLCQKNKFFCDSCCGLQEAEKRMKIKTLPNILAIHLKRFKYQESSGRFAKLFYRVPFPTSLRLPNTTDDMENPDRLYELFAVVVHIGNGPHHGHYVCLIRSAGRWVMCDDENVEAIEDSDIFRYFGDYPSGAGYVLFYQAVDLNPADLGLKVVPKPKAKPPTTVKPPVKAAPAPPTPAAVNDNLVDIAEASESPASPPMSLPESPRAPLSVAIPKSEPPAVLAPPVQTASTTSPSAVTDTSSPSASSPTPVAAKVSPAKTTPAVNGSATSTPPVRQVAPQNTTSTPTSSSKPKEEGTKWYQRRKSYTQDKRTSLLGQSAPGSRLDTTPEHGKVAPSGPTPPRQPAAQPNDVSSPPAMSSSFVSTKSTASSTSQSASSNGARLGSSPSTAANGIPTNNNARDRTISGSSQSSSALGTSNPDKSFSGGQSLGRRMSGLGRMGSRKGSMSLKLGFGKSNNK